MTAPKSRSLLFLGLLWLCACGADGRYVVIGTTRAPGASGIVEVDDLGATTAQVAVHIEFLHPPDRLDPALTRYVVWFIPKTGGAVRAGALNYDSVRRTGDLTQTSPFHHFSLEVTAEHDDKPSKPSAFVIATQTVNVE